MMVYERFALIDPRRMSVVLRTHGDPTPLIAAARASLSKADPEMALSPALSMEQILDNSVSPRKFQMYLAVAFSIGALVLASLGIYGVISFAVARRSPEIGIRIALGAQDGKVMAMVFRQGMAPVMAGLAMGIVGALVVGRYLASLLYGVSPTDPVTMSVVTILLLAVA